MVGVWTRDQQIASIAHPGHYVTLPSNSKTSIKNIFKKIDVLFPLSVFQSFKPVSWGGVRKHVAKTDSQRFAIFFCKFLWFCDLKRNQN